LVEPLSTINFIVRRKKKNSPKEILWDCEKIIKNLRVKTGQSTCWNNQLRCRTMKSL